MCPGKRENEGKGKKRGRDRGEENREVEEEKGRLKEDSGGKGKKEGERGMGGSGGQVLLEPFPRPCFDSVNCKTPDAPLQDELLC